MGTALVIMAAGIGSRFGNSIKQLEPVGLRDEIIMDYSIHDAILAGFDKIIIILRREIEADFRERIGIRIENVCKKQKVELVYVYQDMNDIPAGFTVPEGRGKPWGTGQAVLAARKEIKEPFAVINADDYYGQSAFYAMHDYLMNRVEPRSYCMAGFILKNTLSENGEVTRGISYVDHDNMLTDIVETSHIVRTADGIQADGIILNPESYVSMNMWGLAPEFITLLEEGFQSFFRDKVSNAPLQAEYLLPIYIGQLLHEGAVSVKLLETKDQWFGVTYKEDKPFVAENIKKLIEAGVYSEDLYMDLKHSM
jgi:UTP-glucose-1-phosphate uridylyltransferase